MPPSQPGENTFPHVLPVPGQICGAQIQEVFKDHMPLCLRWKQKKKKNDSMQKAALRCLSASAYYSHGVTQRRFCGKSVSDQAT